MNLKSKFSKLVSAFTAAVMCITLTPSLTGSLSASAAAGDKFTVGNGRNQYTGNSEGYSYEIWLDNTGGSGSMTLGKGATFKAEWSAAVSQGNFLARRGLSFDSSKKATSYDYIGMDYAATYSQTNSGGNSRLCVYGWFENRNAAGNPPLVEYYIIEDWVNWRPRPNGSSKKVTIDGAEYEIFAIDHTGPTIHGNTETFKQYFSIRTNSRTSGHITVSDHFKAWANEGWGIGNLYEVALNAEGWESSGVADVTMLDVYLDPDKAGEDPVIPTTPVEPDENGNYFYAPFESGTDSFSGRGDASVKTDSDNYYAGKKSLFVSGRTNEWNGAEIALDSKAFVPGSSYSFSTAVLQNSGSAQDMKLTLQYNAGGEEQYAEVALVSAKSGEWTKLENTSFTIPSGASNMKLYVEAPDSLTDFYIDEVRGAVEGTKSTVVTGGGTVKGSTTSQTTTTTKITTTATTTTTTGGGNDPVITLWGDANCDGETNISDAVLIMQALANKDKFGVGGSSPEAITAQGALNADVHLNGNQLTAMDALAIQKWLLKMIPSLPESYSQGSQTTAKTTTTTTTSKTTTTTKSGITPTVYMENVRNSFTNNVPGNVTSGDTGKTTKIQYYSKVAGANKSANVWVPAGYDSSKKYNVLYMNHGVFGNEDSMLESSFAVREMASNLIKNGDVEPFIIVFPQMYSGPGGGSPNMGQMNMDTMDNYDKFLADMTDSLMPYIEQNYSVKTGRNNTAIAGFSMGGRESLYLTISRPDLFGYCCASSPAPGIVPASDSFIANHLGSKKADGSRMTNADFKINASDMPYLLMIGGGTSDQIVGTFPQQYHELFAKNGTDHIWESFPGGGHDASVGKPMFYNYMKNLFKASDSSSSSSSGNNNNNNNNNNSNANFFNSTFSSGTDNWESRGSASLALDKESYYSSGSSLKVSGRGDTWQGAQYTLDSSFKAGGTYSFSAAVMQASGSSQAAKMTLQYSLNGETSYDEVASATAADKTWTKLENTAYTIPAGATDLVLYVELPDSTADYFLDDVQAAEKGTASKVTTGKGTVGDFSAATPSTGTIDPSKPMIAISFDDGTNANGKRIINALNKEGFHATFFYVGNWIKDEDQVRLAYSSGMEVANHTNSHPNLSEKSSSEIRSEYDQCAAKLKSIIGAEPSKLLRLPYLASNSTVTSTLKDVPMITCAIDTQDWNGASKDQIVNTIKQAMSNGSAKNAIVLCHETYESTAAAIEELAPYIKAQGWQIVTISEMFAANGKTLNGGQIYTKCN